MSESGHDNDRLEPTIVPVRRSAAAPAETGERPRPPAWRWPLAGAGLALVLAGIVGVFVYLPAWVEQAEPPPEPAAEVPAVPVAPGPELSEEEIAALTAAAEALLAQLLEQQQALEARAVESWGDTTWSSYETAARLADDAFLAENLPEAVRQYEQALEIGDTLLARSERIVDEALAAGEAALASGNPEIAAAQFALVLEIDPDNAPALNGEARAAALPEVLAAMRRGDALDVQGELEAAAEAYREALAIDPDYAAARTTLAALTARIARIRFDRLITEGYAAIDDNRFDDAAEHFDAALAMRPDSEAARDGLAQAEQARQLNEIGMAEVRAMAFEQRELWDQAIARYREALATDPTLKFALEGLERSQRRADLDAKLRTLLGTPQLLLSDAILEDARGLLAEAQAIAEPGPRLGEQIGELDQLIELASTPIPVTLISDNATEVAVLRFGELGSFASREIELKPGNYTAVGRRRGYRDVRETFTVLPGADNGPVTVICAEPIE